MISAFTAWEEFCDLRKKTMRYTRAVRAIKNLLSWWSRLGEVERASMDNRTRLILSGEEIISEERLAWLSTAKRIEQQNQSDGTDDPRLFDSASAVTVGVQERRPSKVPLLERRPSKSSVAPFP
jgi:hypothetical protein